MGIYKSIVNFDTEFANLSVTPIIINDLPNLSDDDQKRNNELIYQQHSSVFNTTPRCNCGHTTQERHLGVICDRCGEPVREVLEGRLESQLWMRPPLGMDTDRFINPGIWQLLSGYFTRTKKPPKDGYTIATTAKPKRTQEGFNPIMWIACTDYHPKNCEHFTHAMQAKGIKRGYSYLVNNFNYVLNTLFNMPQFKRDNQTREELIATLNQASAATFCKFLPLINRNLIVVENEATTSYIDQTSPLAVNAARQLLGIDVAGQELRIAARENRTAKAINDQANFTIEYARNNIGSKPGLARKHLFSTRVAPSSRAVITSLSKPHRYDELHAPWPVAVGMLRTHLENYLMRYGFTPQDMIEFLSYATTNWHPLVEHIFKTVVAQSPEHGLPVTFCRNPSLERASIQLLYLTLVKADPYDPTYGFSLLSIVGPNADYDGDEMGAMMPCDRELTHLLEPLKPHKSAHSVTKYRTMSANFSWPKPAVATFSAALAAPAGPHEADLMAEFAVH